VSESHKADQQVVSERGRTAGKVRTSVEMIIDFPTTVSFIGAIGFFSLAVKLRKFRVSKIPPKPRAGLSREERQRQITIAEWITYSLGVFLLCATCLFAWLANSN
jgi:hypothetical protein